MTNRIKLTAKKKINFLLELEKDGNVTRSAAAVGVRTATCYDHRHKDPEFDIKWAKAVKVGDLALIDEATKRAHAGSDTLLIFMIKGRHPEFREKLIDIPTDARFHLSINTSPPPPAGSPQDRLTSGNAPGLPAPPKKRGRPKKVK